MAVARLDHKVQQFTRQACQEAGVAPSRLLAPFLGEPRLRLLRYVDFTDPSKLSHLQKEPPQSLPRIQGELLDFLKSPDSEPHKHRHCLDWLLEDDEDDEELKKPRIVVPKEAFAEFAKGIVCLSEMRLFAGQPNIDTLRLEGFKEACRHGSTFVLGFRELLDFTPRCVRDRDDVCPIEYTSDRQVYDGLRIHSTLACLDTPGFQPIRWYSNNDPQETRKMMDAY